VDFVDGQIAFDQDDAAGFAGGDLVVFLPDAREEGVLLLLEAGFVEAGIGLDVLVAAAGAGQAEFERGQQQQGQVGLKVPADQPVQFEDGRGAELAAAALVRLGGVGKAVAEDDLPASRAGWMTSAMAWARSANMRAISVMGARPVERESSTSARMRSPVSVPPGWRVRTGSSAGLRCLSQAARRLIWVVLPEPSRPSSVMNRPRGMG
jgi:hypothetical protein